ncbi:MAG: hypothetical protein GC168_11545 [Candidatus Hydrogenedens sp.]|nr:hypothetical protein [Candidatus Hydrogenedens sp.]
MPWMFAVGIAAAALAAPQTYVLRAPINIWDQATEDFNGDGRQDIVLLCADERSDPLEKSAGVYIASEQGGYTEAPTYTIPLDSVSGAFFLAQVDGAGPREIVAAHAEGAVVYRYSESAASGFEKIASPQFDSLLPSSIREPVFLRGSAQDLDGDGTDEWLVPMPNGYQIRHADHELSRVRCDVNSSISQESNVFIRHRLPDAEPYGAADQPLKGLAFLSDEYADFAYGPGWTEHWRFDIPLNLEDKWAASARMADVDQSGFPDLVVVQTRGSMNIEAITQVYVADEAYKYPEKPTARFESKGAVEAPMLVDVDGDGDRDVLVISVPFGVKNLVNYFVRGKISVDAVVYEFANGKFSDKPVFTKSLTFEAPDGRERIAYELADFNGNGRLDLAFSSGGDKLVVHGGDPDDFLTRSPVYEVNVPSFGKAEAHDLRGDGSNDLVITHPGGKDNKRAEVILFN